MKFDASKSKLFPQIMEAAAKFFGLSEDCTETDVHAAFEDAGGPLSEIIANANAKTNQTVIDQLQVLKIKTDEQEQKIDAFDTLIKELKAQIETKDSRILELQAEVANWGVKSAQYKTESEKMATELSKIKAGSFFDVGESGGETHVATTVATRKQDASIVEIKSDALKDILKKRNN